MAGAGRIMAPKTFTSSFPKPVTCYIRWQGIELRMLSGWLYKTTLDYIGGKCNHKCLNRDRSGGPGKKLWPWKQRSEVWVIWLLASKMEEGTSQGIRQPPETGKGKKTNSLLEAPNAARLMPGFSPGRTIFDFWPPELQGSLEPLIWDNLL